MLKKHIKQFILSIAKFGVAGLLIYWMIRNGMLDINRLVDLITPVNAIAFMVIILIQFIINNYRWSLLLNSVGFTISKMKLFTLSLIGIFFNFAVPGGVGGDVVKGYYLVQDYPKKRMLAVMSMLMDRIIGMYAMVFMGLASFFIDYSLILANTHLFILFIAVICLFAGMTLFFALAFSRRVNQKGFLQKMFEILPGGSVLKKTYEAAHLFGQRRWYFVVAFVISLISQSFIIVCVALVAHQMGMPLEFPVYFFMVPLGLITTVLPISPAGIGVGQAAFYYLYVTYTGVENQLGPNALTIYQAASLCWGLVGAFLYITKKKPVLTNLNEVEAKL